MNRSPRIRLTSDQLGSLLKGRAVETEFRGARVPARGESYPVMMQESAEVRAIVVGQKLKPRCKRAWLLNVVLDRSEGPLLLNAESAGGVIIPMSDDRSPTDPVAHGYTDNPNGRVLDADEAVPHEDVVTFAESQAAARRHAAEKVDKFAKRRAKSMGSRVENVLLQARARGIEPDIDALEGWLESCEEGLKEAA